MSQNYWQTTMAEAASLCASEQATRLLQRLRITLGLWLTVAVTLTACSELRAQTPSTDSLTREQLTTPLRSCEEAVDGTRRWLATQNYSPRQRPVKDHVVYAVLFTQNESNAERSIGLYLVVTLVEPQASSPAWVLEYVDRCRAPDDQLLWVSMYRAATYEKTHNFRS